MKKELIDILREESESEHVAFTQFALVYKKDKDVLYCFFEGNDDKKYYGFRIKHIAERNFKDFTCGGKDAVLGVYKLIKSKKEYKKANTLYFIDRDFENNTKMKDIYITPYYSVENFYTSIDVLIDILKNEFNLKEEDDDFAKVISLYQKLQKLFHDCITLFNSWLYCQYEIRNKNMTKTNLNIDSVVGKYFNKIVDDNLNDVNEFSELNDIDFIEEKLFPDAPRVDMDILQERIKFFKKSNRQQLFRGKFEIKFLISFLQKLQNEIGKKSPSLFSRRHKCNLRFEYNNALSVLTQYAETPDCLKDYLRHCKLRSNNDVHITNAALDWQLRCAPLPASELGRWRLAALGANVGAERSSRFFVGLRGLRKVGCNKTWKLK